MFGRTGFLRRLKALLGCSVLVVGTAIVQGASSVEALYPPQIFNFTGSAQTFTVPTGVCSVTVEAFGAAGGSAFSTAGGLGGEAKATFSVGAGEALQVYVGGQGGTLAVGATAGGAGGFNGGASGGSQVAGPPFTNASAGGGGGGASDVRRAPATLADRIIVAGGGGGSATTGSPGDGGGMVGGDGNRGVGLGSSFGGGGGGGTQSAGGTGGTGGSQSPFVSGMPGASGASGVGGRGGDASSAGPGGGGGGGYFGGGGGGGGANQSFGSAGGGGGGGGSAFGPVGVTFMTGVRPGDGMVVITPGLACPTLTTTATSATLGGTISDTGLLSGGVTPTGTITFQLFGPNTTCTGLAAFTSIIPVTTGNGSYTSGSFTPTVAGTYFWVASYGGDANNNPATTHCGDAGETSTVTAAACQEADGNGDFQGQQGQQANLQMDSDNCEESGHGGNGDTAQGDRVTSSNRGDGTAFTSTQIQSTKFDSRAHTVTITGVGTSNGTRVAFTLVALETGVGVPGWVSLVFSDGYSIAGNLLNGSITLH